VETLVSKAVSFSVESSRQKEVRFDVLLASLAGKFRRIISYKLSADMNEYSLALSLAFSLHESDTIFYPLCWSLFSDILHEEHAIHSTCARVFQTLFLF